MHAFEGVWAEKKGKKHRAAMGETGHLDRIARKPRSATAGVAFHVLVLFVCDRTHLRRDYLFYLGMGGIALQSPIGPRDVRRAGTNKTFIRQLRRFSLPTCEET